MATKKCKRGRPHSGRPPLWDHPVPLSVMVEIGEDVMAHLDEIREHRHDALMVEEIVHRARKGLIDQGIEFGVPYVQREPAAV